MRDDFLVVGFLRVFLVKMNWIGIPRYRSEQFDIIHRQFPGHASRLSNLDFIERHVVETSNQHFVIDTRLPAIPTPLCQGIGTKSYF